MEEWLHLATKDVVIIIDAMALIAKWAWAAVGGYAHIPYGWEDYDFWCRCVEHGLWGQQIPEILADSVLGGDLFFDIKACVNLEALIQNFFFTNIFS